ncbi:D-alanyl-D-alanine carboxypeptidase [Anaerobacillus alkaliphilus]|uniref:D-alanyl-D-alanine carboxypeptidase n=1 Tax=Anaerobacillus alkaliphilus TaxID=1548597 RepID=A0A4Q0VX83_9BACI|nr:stalk domain-containing protein [Anaerobacillus alkaliphilus]RXJ02942.1 D-alanyl-D-alanine carboxypeptidase [Anaerobacillus alkaliphilus]
MQKKIVMLFIVLFITTLPSYGQATTSKTLDAYVKPFFIQYENQEILAEHDMLTIHGRDYFPLVDLLKLLNGSVRLLDEKIDVHLVPNVKQTNFIEVTRPLPKKVQTLILPTFQESIQAGAGAIIENDPSNIMFSKNGNEKHYPASTTKIMTALVALEKSDLKENVKISQDVRNIPSDSSRANVRPGDVMTLEQLLFAMMVPSGNDAAVAVAVHIAGSEREFAQLMNQKAKELGATNTNFVNSHGYHDPNQYTTAIDLAKITYAATKHPQFLQFISVPSYRATYKNSSGTTVTRTWEATNQQVRKDRPNYAPNIIGGKTGYTSASRHTLVSVAEKDSNQYITVILRGDPTGRYVDTQKLVKKAIAARKANNEKYSVPIKITYVDRELVVNGKSQVLDQQVFTYQGRLYMHMDTIPLLTEKVKEVTVKQEDYKLVLDQIMVPHINDLLLFRDSRLFLPFRAISEHYEFAVNFNKDGGVIKASKQGFEIKLTIDSKTAEVNGKKLVLDSAPFIMNGTTYLPTRFLADTISDSFDWGIGHTLVLK